MDQEYWGYPRRQLNILDSNRTHPHNLRLSSNHPALTQVTDFFPNIQTLLIVFIQYSDFVDRTNKTALVIEFGADT